MPKEVKPEVVKEFEKAFTWVDESIITEQVAKREDVVKALNEKGTIKVKIGHQEKPFWRSKKFWGGIIALAIILAGQISGTDLWTVALPIMVYVFGQGLADLGKNKTEP